MFGTLLVGFGGPLARSAMSRVRPHTSEVIVAVGMLLAQAFAYALSIGSSRAQGSELYGEFASLLTVSVLTAIPALAMQSWVARAVANDVRAGEPLGTAVADVLRGVVVVAVATVVLAVGISLSLSRPIGTDPGHATLAVLLVVLPLVFLSAAQGWLQGTQRLGRLAVVLVLVAAGRMAGGGAVLLTTHQPWLIMCGIGAGTFAMAAFAWRWSGLPLGQRAPAEWRVFAQVLRITFATGSMWVLSNIDIVLARSLLPASAAGRYAVGALVTRGVLWAPQFVGVSAFASMTDRGTTLTQLRVALVKVACLCAVAVLALWLVGPPLVAFVFGGDYRRVSHLAWLFGLLGSLLAINQLLVLQRVARHDEAAAAMAWASTAVAIGLVVGRFHGSVVQVVTALCAVNAVLVVALYRRASIRV
jgi:O-antigen/teichoic acid export membrane protein